MNSVPALVPVAAALLLLLPSWARADDPRPVVRPKEPLQPIVVERTSEPGVVSGTRLETMNGHVRSVDLARREITLRVAGDREETFQVGPEAKNLEILQPGDRVTIRYRVGLVVRMQAPDREDTAPEASNDGKRVGRGNVLAGTETVQARATMTVESIDAASRMVTLRGPDGRTYRVQAGPDVRLERLKVGDKVVATYSVALAVSVEPIYRE